jgi:hypothetical protein
MTTCLKNSLLSLLLALKNLSVPLTDSESSALADISEQLMYHPDAWDIIEPDLNKILQGNPSLNHLYQDSLTKLAQLKGKLPPNVLPTLAELETEIPSDSNEPADFSHFMDLAAEGNLTGESDRESLEVLNASIKVLSTANPEQTAKKVRGLERVWQILQKPIF